MKINKFSTFILVLICIRENSAFASFPKKLDQIKGHLTAADGPTQINRLLNKIHHKTKAKNSYKDALSLLLVYFELQTPHLGSEQDKMNILFEKALAINNQKPLQLIEHAKKLAQCLKTTKESNFFFPKNLEYIEQYSKYLKTARSGVSRKPIFPTSCLLPSPIMLFGKHIQKQNTEILCQNLCKTDDMSVLVLLNQLLFHHSQENSSEIIHMIDQLPLDATEHSPSILDLIKLGSLLKLSNEFLWLLTDPISTYIEMCIEKDGLDSPSIEPIIKKIIPFFGHDDSTTKIALSIYDPLLDFILKKANGPIFLSEDKTFFLCIDTSSNTVTSWNIQTGSCTPFCSAAPIQELTDRSMPNKRHAFIVSNGIERTELWYQPKQLTIPYHYITVQATPAERLLYEGYIKALALQDKKMFESPSLLTRLKRTFSQNNQWGIKTAQKLNNRIPKNLPKPFNL